MARRTHLYVTFDRDSVPIEGTDFSRAGQQTSILERGDPVGYVGVTGNAAKDAPHLHFAVAELSYSSMSAPTLMAA